MSGSWREYLTLRVHLDPLVYLHLFEVLLWVSVLGLLFRVERTVWELLISRIEVHQAELGRIRAYSTVADVSSRLDRTLCLLSDCLACDWLLNAGPIEVISLHPIEASKYEEPLVVEHDCLVESARSWRDV